VNPDIVVLKLKLWISKEADHSQELAKIPDSNFNWKVLFNLCLSKKALARGNGLKPRTWLDQQIGIDCGKVFKNTEGILREFDFGLSYH
jgi:hypothetical protein